MKRDHRLLVTLLVLALMFYIVGTLDQTARCIVLIALAFIVFGLWNRR